MENLFLDSKEVAEILKVSQPKAYKVIREMNEKLAEQGFLTIRGRINRQYFLEQIYQPKEVK
ncbi:MAG: DNA-binding protein [Saccharofermentanales bacterium]|jgi:sugar-specific transcriptional regulator TrmB